MTSGGSSKRAGKLEMRAVTAWLLRVDAPHYSQSRGSMPPSVDAGSDRVIPAGRCPALQPIPRVDPTSVDAGSDRADPAGRCPALQEMQMPSIGPLDGVPHQACTHRVVHHIVPLPLVTFLRAKYVIKEVPLPLEIGQPDPAAQEFAAPLFPGTDVSAEACRLATRRTEQMHVIRHDHIAPDLPAVALIAGLPHFTKNGVNCLMGQKVSPCLDTNRQEENRRIDPNLSQSAQSCKSTLRRLVMHGVNMDHNRSNLK